MKLALSNEEVKAAIATYVAREVLKSPYTDDSKFTIEVRFSPRVMMVFVDEKPNPLEV